MSAASVEGGPDCTVEVYMSEESKEGVTVFFLAGGQLQELPRVLNLERESWEHFRWTHLEQVQHCTDLPCQVTFPEMRRRRRAKEGQEKRKGENRWPILKKLCAAILQSFRGQHSKKMKGVSEVTGTLKKANNHFDPTQMVSGTAPPR